MQPKVEKTDDEILFNGLPMYFYKGEYDYLKPDDVKFQKTDTGIKFGIESPIPTTMVVPCEHRRLIIGDEYNYIDTRIVTKHYCEGPTKILDNSNCTPAYSPVIHIQGDESYSCSVFGECLIFSFVKDYEQYTSITGVPDHGKITFHIDVSPNYRTNLHRPKVSRRIQHYYGLLDLGEIEHVIFHGTRLEKREPNINDVLSHAKRVQKYLKDEDLYSVITGSLAELLNGINCHVRDCDFMLKSYGAMIHASEHLRKNGYSLMQQNDKWISLKSKSGKTVDLSYDNYRLLQLPHYIRESHGLRFFDTEGLLWLAMSNLYEQSRTPYRHSYPRNERALFELTRHAYKRGITCNTTVAKTLDNLNVYTDNCVAMSDQLSSLEILFKDTRINEPFRVNCFGNEDHRIFSVINPGTVANFRLITDLHAQTATWKDVAGKDQKVRIDKHENFSMFFVTDVDLPGVLTCDK